MFQIELIILLLILSSSWSCSSQPCFLSDSRFLNLTLVFALLSISHIILWLHSSVLFLNISHVETLFFILFLKILLFMLLQMSPFLPLPRFVHLHPVLAPPSLGPSLHCCQCPWFMPMGSLVNPFTFYYPVPTCPPPDI